MMSILIALVLDIGAGCHAKLLQLCLTLYNTMDCIPAGSSVHGILQTRILEWVAIPSPRDLPDPASLNLLHWQVDSFTTGATWEASLEVVGGGMFVKTKQTDSLQ